MKEERPKLARQYIKEGKLSDPDQVYHLLNAVSLMGECMDMCPEFEREEREYSISEANANP